IRTEDGDHDAECEVGKKILADSVQQEDRKEDDGGADGRGEHSQRYFASPLGRSTLRFGAFLHKWDDIFQHDDGVVDDPGEHQRQAPQQHGVDSAAKRASYQHAQQQRPGYGEQRRESGAAVAEEEQNHETGECKADERFLQQVLDRAFHEEGLIKDDGGFQAGWNIHQLLDSSTHAVDDLDGVALAGLLENGYID